jgi:hypothetical protein
MLSSGSSAGSQHYSFSSSGREFVGPLKSNRQPGGHKNILLANGGQLRLQLIGLDAPTQHPRQSEIESDAKGLCKRCVGLWCDRAMFLKVYCSEQGLGKRPEPAN